ncbi:hypothetical protein PPERSA_11637 [Pseudocohnilembus persalinus]|uniref:Transmembrane protein n=1 Tax=Pseudocohnilembus persalinus TaxID=266149 RepID=A0A0V0Q9X2_PSEPJ|nr:hypothetical protein PPERSA_11637 [Pseudocohnilembus persalinus]|eukprot:KRW99036.1 hypothetical protein PPERSA_11637 [Pseudocohnilembus persalinus]
MNGDMKYIKLTNQKDQQLANIIYTFKNRDISLDLEKNSALNSLQQIKLQNQKQMQEILNKKQKSSTVLKTQPFYNPSFFVFQNYIYEDEKIKNSEYFEKQLQLGDLYYSKNSQKIAISMQNNNLFQETEDPQQEIENLENNNKKQQIINVKNMENYYVYQQYFQTGQNIEEKSEEFKQFSDHLSKEEQFLKIGQIYSEKHKKILQILFEEQNQIKIAEIGRYKDLVFKRFCIFFIFFGGFTAFYNILYKDSLYFSPLIKNEEIAKKVFNQIPFYYKNLGNQPEIQQN